MSKGFASVGEERVVSLRLRLDGGLSFELKLPYMTATKFASLDSQERRLPVDSEAVLL